ncbi:hypothetical protein BSPWISOXPB_3468 [uncultured Gammaproteobacteria bacterium]|nr:hypothetical protein BSPWISOXPB_3468 [uncultured Gammaproteobacteria bacterium]
MVELGYTQAVDIKLIADSQDNRKDITAKTTTST